jgi:hypothetical protein
LQLNAASSAVLQASQWTARTRCGELFEIGGIINSGAGRAGLPRAPTASPASAPSRRYIAALDV